MKSTNLSRLQHLIPSLCGAAAGGVVALSLSSSGELATPVSASAAAVTAEDIARLSSELDSMKAELGQRAPSGSLLNRDAERAEVVADPALRDERIVAIVRGLITKGVVGAGESWIAEEVEPSWPAGAATAEAAALLMVETGMDSEAGRALWREAHENGRLTEMLHAVDDALSLKPASADVETERALAYYEAARIEPNYDDGNWWVDSDNAFAAALEMEPEHWKARYRRAVNLSFWPAAYGGQSQAIENFETLIDQQSRMPLEGRFADTYYWLGNLYSQQGRGDDARRTYALGNRLHPDNERLAERVKSR